MKKINYKKKFMDKKKSFFNEIKKVLGEEEIKRIQSMESIYDSEYKYR